MTEKPPFPTDLSTPWPRIPVDQTNNSDFQQIRRAATLAADGLMLGDHGPARDAPRVHHTAAAVQEALLYLLELGLIDIDTERLSAFMTQPHPMFREGR